MKKQIIYPLMAALTFCAALTFNGCGASTGFVEQPNDGNQTVIENPFDGEIVKDGESYSFGRAIAFLGADVAPIDEEVYTPVTATLTATVEPIDANQNVIWTTSFVNPSSTWANGKTVSDYITLATETAGSTTCTVTCKAPFGEQIIITCTSQENTAISADCTVDFVQTISNVALTFGNDLPINLGGVTPIEWEMNPTGIGKGGAANVTYDLGDTYTIEFGNISWDIDLISPEYFKSGLDDEGWGSSIHVKEDSYHYVVDNSYVDGYFTFFYGGGNPNSDYDDVEHDIGLNRMDGINELCFDQKFLVEISRITSPFLTHSAGASGFSYLTFSENTTANEYHNFTFFVYYDEELKSYYDDEGFYIYDYSKPAVGLGVLTEGSMWTLRLSLSFSDLTKEYTSLLELTGFTSNPMVQSVSFENTSLKF